MTVVATGLTFVCVDTFALAVASKARFTLASVCSFFVGTNGICMTLVGKIAFVDIDTEITAYTWIGISRKALTPNKNKISKNVKYVKNVKKCLENVKKI